MYIDFNQLNLKNIFLMNELILGLYYKIGIMSTMLQIRFK